MEIKWSQSIYTYKKKYDVMNWSLVVNEKKNDFIITLRERLLEEKEDINGNSVNTFSGQYEITTLKLCNNTGHIKSTEKETTEKPSEPPDKPFSKSPDTRHYIFGKYDVFMEGKWTLCCYDTNIDNVVWRKNVKHWLYSEIECNDDILYFSTQGNGGLFYGLSLETGDEIFSYPNSSTEYYWIGHNLLYCNEKEFWALIDSKTGEKIETTPISGNIVHHIGNDYILLNNMYNRSTRQYDGKLYCISINELYQKDE